MALENDDLIVVQKNGGGELRKAKIGDIKPDVPINDGAINIDGGDGITASGDNATANQDGDTTRTLSVDETWLSTWLDTNHPLPETFWTEDSGNLYPTTLTNNVGIGTDSPGEKLHVKSNGVIPTVIQSTDTRSQINFRNSGGSTTYIGSDQGDFKILTNGNERVRVDFSGNVGIGTDSPAAPLTVKRGTIQITDENSISTGDIGSYGCIWSEDANISLAGYGCDIYTGGNNNRTLSMTVASDGNVGIGTDSPESLFHLKSDDAEVLQIMENSVGTVKLYSNNKNFIVDADQHRFRSESGDEYARILANGNVGIGTYSPESRLTINPGNSSNTSIGGRDIAYGVNAITSSGRSGFLVRSNNNFLQDNDNSAFQYLYPFNDGITSDYKVFRTAKGSTLSDVFWTSINGNGYFAGNVGIGTDAPSGKLDVQNGANRAIKFEVDGTSGDNHIKSYQGNSENVRNLRITGQEIAIDTNSSGESQGVNRIKVLTNGDVGIGVRTRPHISCTLNQQLNPSQRLSQLVLMPRFFLLALAAQTMETIFSKQVIKLSSLLLRRGLLLFLAMATSASGSTRRVASWKSMEHFNLVKHLCLPAQQLLVLCM